MKKAGNGGGRKGGIAGCGNLPPAAELARALAEGIGRLHEARGELVLRAKAQREAGERAARDRTWESVQELTLQIEQSEADLAALGGRAAAAAGAAWHDPELKDYPDADISVVALCTHPDEDGPVIKRMYLTGGGGWRNAETDRVSRFRVIGWMTDPEAIETIKFAGRKAVRHG